MALDPIIIHDDDMERWGNLIKTWSTGENRLGDGNTYPLPQSLDEFKYQLELAKVRMTIPARITSVQFVQYSPEVIAVRVPPKEMILDMEQRLSQGAPYPIRAFYSKIFNNTPPNVPQADKLHVHSMRIGDYSISACA